jgi:hypothetical protein
MKQLLNSLYVTTQGAYLARDGEARNVLVRLPAGNSSLYMRNALLAAKWPGEADLG